MTGAITCGLLAIAACSTYARVPMADLSARTAGDHAFGDEHVSLFGDPITIYGSWDSGHCHVRDVAGPGWLDRVINNRKAVEDTWCDQLRVVVAVRCSRPCDIARKPLLVTPRELGPLTIHTAVTRTDTGQTEARDFTYTIVNPDRIVLACGDFDARIACGPEGVAALAPIVRPYVIVGEHHAGGALLRVNGKPVAHEAISLADLFPEARRGNGAVARGRYRVVVSFGEQQEIYMVEAQ